MSSSLLEYEGMEGDLRWTPLQGAWRGSARQARLARLLAMVDIRGAHLTDARAAGELLAATATADVVDALVALLPVPGDQLLTSDPDDLRTLVAERGIPVTVVPV